MEGRGVLRRLLEGQSEARALISDSLVRWHEVLDAASAVAPGLINSRSTAEPFGQEWQARWPGGQRIELLIGTWNHQVHPAVFVLRRAVVVPGPGCLGLGYGAAAVSVLGAGSPGVVLILS